MKSKKDNRSEKNKMDTRSTSDKTMRSPLTPQKRKRTAETSVLTEVRKRKAKRSTSSEDSADSDSTSEDSHTSPPLLAVGKRRMSTRRSPAHDSEKQKASSIAVVEVGDDASASTNSQ